MKSKIALLLCACCFFLTTSAWAQSAGTTSSDFLNIGIGGRPVAMGEAYTALASGASAAYWNPAGMVGASAIELLSTHADWFEDTSSQYLGVIFPTNQEIALGLSYNLFNYGSIAGYSSSGSRTADINAYDRALTLSYARKLNKKLSFGLNLKYVNEVLANAEAKTYGVDLGFLLNVNQRLSIGLVSKNLLGSLKMDQTSALLPGKTSFGLAFKKLWDRPLTLSFDYNFPIYETNYYSYGLEYNFNDFFSLRAGGLKNRFHTGVGFKTPNFCLDYAYAPVPYLGATHRLSLSFRFGVREQELVESYYNKGKQLYRQKKYLDALLQFRQVLEIDQLHKDSREFINRIVEEMRQEALEEKVKSLVARKKKAQALLKQAVIAFSQNDYSQAKKLVDQSLELAPGNKEALKLKDRLGKVIKIEKKQR